MVRNIIIKLATKYISIVFILFITSSCDVEYPDEWQSPTWELPLTIPLIDQMMPPEFH